MRGCIVSVMDHAGVIREMMRAGKLNQSQVARRLRVTQPTVSRWLKGVIPDTAQHQRIMDEARRLRLFDEQDQEEERIAPRTVPVKGYVGAGAEAHFYAVSQGDLDEVPAPEWATANTVAVEIRGSSLGTLFDRWLVYYDDVHRPMTPELIGKTCVVGLDTGQILIKKVIRSRTSGKFDLISQTDEPIRDVEIEWAAEVKHIARP
jgi:transcriptional regulator with XRE-family HTH domain